MLRSLALKAILLLLVFAGMFAFTRHLQSGRLVRLRLQAADSERRLQRLLAEQALAEPARGAPGHWLHTRGRHIVTDQGRRWRATGSDYAPSRSTLRQTGFVRLSAAPFFGPEPSTVPSQWLRLAAQVDELSQGGRTYVLVHLPLAGDAELWRAHMATLVHVLAKRPYVLFDISHPDGGPSTPSQIKACLSAGEQLACIRQAELDVAAPEHLVAVDVADLGAQAAHSHPHELDSPPLSLPPTWARHNVVALGRRPAYALHAANALFLAPVRQRLPSVQPAS